MSAPAPAVMKILTLTNCLNKPVCALAKTHAVYFKFCPGEDACAKVVGLMRWAQHLYDIGWPDRMEEEA